MIATMNGSILNTQQVNGPAQAPFSSDIPAKAYVVDTGVSDLRPNTRGTSVGIIIRNRYPNTRWALEGATGESRDAGRRRK